MTGATQKLLDAALKLSDAERAELAAVLADSVGDGTSREEIDAAWIAEAKRRLGAVHAGAAVIASDDVESELVELIDAIGDGRRAG